MNRLIISFLILSISIFFLSCEKSSDYYLGIQQQPVFENDSIVEGLNIFGLLRPDMREGFNKSFVFLQDIYPILEENDFRIIKNADVIVEVIANDQIEDTVIFPLLPSDSLFQDTLYRSNESFIPIPNKTYRLSCSHLEYSQAQGETIFPEAPRVKAGSLIKDQQKVQFVLIGQATIHMYDIYYLATTRGELLERFVPEHELDNELFIKVQLPKDQEVSSLIIYGYDANLASYYANSNTALNINKYRTTISTLESGYGVFGSLNFTVLSIE